MNKVVTSETKILAEGAIFVALSVILKDVLPPIFQLPQGGSRARAQREKSLLRELFIGLVNKIMLSRSI